MKTINEIMREHLPQCYLKVGDGYCQCDDSIEISPDLIRELMIKYALGVQKEQKRISSIWGAALFYNKNHPSESLIDEFHKDMLEAPNVIE